MQRSIIVSGLLLLSAVAAFAEAPVGEAFPSRVSDTPARQVAPQVTRQGTALLLSRIDAMQQELQELRGKLEVQAHDLKMLTNQQRSLYNDLDNRMANIKSKAPAAQALDLDNPRLGNNLQAAPAAVQDDGKQAYTAAYDFIKNKNFPQATSAMRAFLQTYPNSPYQANAHYWLGELYLHQNQIDQAINEFNLVINKYPDSGKVAGSMLKLGFAYFDKGKWDQAKAILHKVQQQFPDTASARLAMARLQDMNQQGM